MLDNIFKTFSVLDTETTTLDAEHGEIIGAARKISDWGFQEFCSSKGKSPQELRVVPLDVMAAILSSDGMTATQMKE